MLLPSLFITMDILLESFSNGIIPGIIILIYLVIVRYFDHRKDIEKQRAETEEKKKTVKINTEILDCFNNLNDYLKKLTVGVLDREEDKCEAAIRSSFKAMGQSLAKFAVFTIISNNIKQNRENIIDNIDTTVYSEFATVYNELSLYSYKNTKLIDAIKDSWKQELINDLKNIIFDENSTKENKIYNIHNKLNLRINNYISLIQNLNFYK